MIRFGVDPDALASRMVDDFSRTVLQGALRVADDDKNPIRGNLFASAIRELLTHMLHELAPENEVKQCSWFNVETDDGRPTRAQRQRYVIQGGLSDRYVKDALQLDADDLRRQLGDSVKALHKATHLRPGSVVGDDRTVDALAQDALGSLVALLDAIDHCRLEMMMAVTEAVVDEATDEVLRETIQTIDELATHHSIEEIYVDDVKTVRIDAHFVWYRATGTIGAELQWGSNSDLRRGDGATLNHSFPFICDIPAPVNDPGHFETSMVDLRVSDGGWRD
ncbi:hypothetical protein [Rhodoligotrophos defluvii]|uniref:pPIWI-associating nuclease domain-containing protein n=1 Tax=Rhodoligotrophos defluvii TaxID=2561934 RepID=UPI0010C98DF2|nr:hypothetical protein [Rhodoligotrophos defluvii]